MVPIEGVPATLWYRTRVAPLPIATVQFVCSPITSSEFGVNIDPCQPQSSLPFATSGRAVVIMAASQ